MQDYLDTLITQGTFGELPMEVVYLLGVVLSAALVIFVFALTVAGITTFVERRVWARIQSRIGPNRVGPQGILQWLADGIKLLMKEDCIPTEADSRLFKLAPYIVTMGFVAAFVVVPFSGSLIVADLNVGILYLTAVTSLVVVGILMAGWASNNKFSLIGGVRAAAQIVSYEIPAALSIFPIVLIAGTLSMQGIILAQGWAPWDWFVFRTPFTFFAFFHPVCRSARRGQPDAVRSSRGGIRARGRIRHRVQWMPAIYSSSSSSGATSTSSVPS